MPGEPLTQELADWGEIILGNVPAGLLHGREDLLWLQTNSAGVEAYVKPGVLAPGTLLTNATGAYGLAISEHMLGVLLSLMKNLELYRTPRKRGPAVPGAGGLPVGGHGAGAGHGGHRRGVRPPVQGPGGQGHRGAAQPRACPDYAQEVHTLEDLDQLLPQADVVAVTLPGTEATRGLLGREQLAAMKQGAYLLNVGRGFIVTRKLCATPWRAAGWGERGWTSPTRNPCPRSTGCGGSPGRW